MAISPSNEKCDKKANDRRFTINDLKHQIRY